MKFSMFLNPTSLRAANDRRVLHETIEQALYADEAGFACVLLSEHHFTGYNTFSSPLVFGAWLGSQFTQAYLSSAVVIPALYHPARIAEEANLLDQLMGGRYILGVGAGGIPSEFAGYGLHIDRAHEVTDEQMDAVHELWAKEDDGEPLEIKTELYQGRLLERIMPASYRAPHPHVMRVGFSPEKMPLYAARGYSLFVSGPDAASIQARLTEYRQLLEAAGHSQERIDLAMEWCTTPTAAHVAETTEEAMRNVEGPFSNLATWAARQGELMPRLYPGEDVGQFFRPSGPGAGPPRDSAGGPPAGGPPAGGPPAGGPSVRPGRMGMWGDPDSVAALVQEHVDGGVRNLNIGFAWGEADHETIMRGLKLFAEEVMPRFPEPTTGDPTPA